MQYDNNVKNGFSVVLHVVDQEITGIEDDDAGYGERNSHSGCWPVKRIPEVRASQTT